MQGKTMASRLLLMLAVMLAVGLLFMAVADASTTNQSYVVKKGDTLYAIAKRCGTTVSELAAVNNIKDPSRLQVGQKLLIPRKVTAASRDGFRTGGTAAQQVSGVLTLAKGLLGKPYAYGAAGPNAFDCSGFVLYVYQQSGLKLPRVASQQAKAGIAVSRNALQPGDLVFFNTVGKGISHVGIYLGSNDFIHASSGKGKVVITSLNNEYYRTRYVTARRLLH